MTTSKYTYLMHSGVRAIYLCVFVDGIRIFDMDIVHPDNQYTFHPKIKVNDDGGVHKLCDYAITTIDDKWGVVSREEAVKQVVEVLQR